MSKENRFCELTTEQKAAFQSKDMAIVGDSSRKPVQRLAALNRFFQALKSEGIKTYDYEPLRPVLVFINQDQKGFQDPHTAVIYGLMAQILTPPVERK